MSNKCEGNLHPLEIVSVRNHITRDGYRIPVTKILQQCQCGKFIKELDEVIG